MTNKAEAVLIAFDPSPEDWPLIKERWPQGVRPIVLKKDGPGLTDEELNSIFAVVGPMRGASLDVITRAPNLRLIHTLGHGVDALLQEKIRTELIARGIKVCRSNAAGITIAEFIICNMIALSRRLFKVHALLTTAGDWSTKAKADRSNGEMGGELWESTLGIVGYGHIGKETARRAKALGMTVGALVRQRKEGADLDFQESDLKSFLQRSDYVVITAPLTDQTRRMFNEESIQWMRDGSYLINISRGPIIDEGAVHSALRSGKLAGVALDVFDVEERGGTLSGYPSEHDFTGLNVILTPHLSGATKETRIRAMKVIGSNLRNMLEGKPLENEVDLSHEY